MPLIKRQTLPDPQAGVGCLLSCLLMASVLLLAPESPAQSPSVQVLAVDGAIGPATRDYVVRGITLAEEAGALLVVLRMDTPGGLDASMRDIIGRILNAEVPVATWVGPAGARAASAGTYILYASHIAAMAPSTHLGAATPVAIGGRRTTTAADKVQTPASPDNEAGEEKDDKPGDASSAKAIEDAVAYIRGLAERHGRNADWAERAVREAVTLTATEALAENVIDLLAKDLEELLAQLDGREVVVNGRTVALATGGAVLEFREPDWRSRLLAVITNPTLAYILMLIGIYGLILEGYNPGGLVPGVIGGICLLLALYAFQLLPVNFAGLALVVLGTLLLMVELFVPSFGILGIGGIIAVIFGSIIMMDTDTPGFGINPGVVAVIGGLASTMFLAVMYLVLKVHRAPRVSGVEQLIGARAEALDDFHEGRGRVHLQGEDWSARSARSVRRGQTVRVLSLDGLVLKVEPVPNEGEST